MKYNDSESYNDEVEATIASLQAQLEHPARVMQKQYRDLWTKVEEKLAEISDMHVKKCLAYRELEAKLAREVESNQRWMEWSKRDIAAREKAEAKLAEALISYAKLEAALQVNRDAASFAFSDAQKLQAQVDLLEANIHVFDNDNAHLMERIEELQSQVDESISIFKWLLGIKGCFPSGQTTEGRFYWRTPLRDKLNKAGLEQALQEKKP